MISGSQKSIIFSSIFHGFFEVSPETLSEAIFGAKISNLASKVRFWSDFGFSRGPKIRSGSACDPPERVGMVFAIRCFTILHCTSPHITFSLVCFLSCVLSAGKFTLTGANWGVLGAPEIENGSQNRPGLLPNWLFFSHFFVSHF